MRCKAAIFDADGVLTLPEELFSRMYAQANGRDPLALEPFFKEAFPAALLGKADLKELITAHNDLWQWEGKIEDLLDQWFASENVQNQKLLDRIAELRQDVPCYLATNQEKYRGEYMKTTMFPDLFDGYFVSAELGTKKPDAAFFEKVLHAIQQDVPGIQPGEIFFLDDTTSHVAGAKAAGIDAHLFTTTEEALRILAKK